MSTTTRDTREIPLGSIAFVLLAFAWSPSAAKADEVGLKNGQHFEGIARRELGKVVVDTGSGTFIFPADQVQDIRPGDTAMAEYPKRLDALGPRPTAEQLFRLALWARDQGLVRYVHPLLEQTVALDPDHAEARDLLGEVKYQGRWMLRSERQGAGETLVEKKAPAAPARKPDTPVVKRKRYAHPLPEMDPGYVYFGIPPMAPRRGTQNHGGYGYAFPIIAGLALVP